MADLEKKDHHQSGNIAGNKEERNISPEVKEDPDDTMDNESKVTQLQRPNSTGAAGETWTIIDKEEIEAESDAESIEVISEDESVGSKSTSSSTSYVHLSDETNLTSSFSLPSCTTSSDGSVKDQETEKGTSGTDLDDDNPNGNNQEIEQGTQDDNLEDDNGNGYNKEIEQGTTVPGVDLEEDNPNGHNQDIEPGTQDANLEDNEAFGQIQTQEIEQGSPDVKSDDDLDYNEVTQPKNTDNTPEQESIAMNKDVGVTNESEHTIYHREPIPDLDPNGYEVCLEHRIEYGDPALILNHESNEPDAEQDLVDLDHGFGVLGEPANHSRDDGLPGAPLLPPEENEDNFPMIGRGLVYRYSRNQNINYLLSGILVVILAMVIGLGVGHFRGLSGQIEMDKVIGKEKLTTCMDGRKEMPADDKHVDKSIVLQLKDENEQLRKELERLKGMAKSKTEEAVLDALKKKMNVLVAENVDLEEEVARLRIAADKGEHVNMNGKPDTNSEDVPKSDWLNDKEELVAEVSKWLLYGLTEAQKTVSKFGNILEKDGSEKSHFGIHLEEDWSKKLNQEVSNIMIALENKWEEIRNEWEKGDVNAYATEKPTEDTEKENMTDSGYNDWNSKREEGREKLRVSNTKADWLFERARYRDDHRQDERRSDWYFGNKLGSSETDYQEHGNKEERTCFKDFGDCQEDDKEQNILGKANKWKKIMKEKANRWGEIIEEEAKAWGKPIKEKSSKWGKIVEEEAKAWGKPIKEKATKWGNRIQEEAKSWGIPIKEKSSKWGKIIKEEANEWRESIKDKANKWEKVIKEEARAWGNPIKEKASKWGKMIKEETNAWRKPIKQNVNKWGEIIKEEANEWGEVIKEKTNSWSKVINEEANKWGDYIKENINDRLDKIQKKN